MEIGNTVSCSLRISHSSTINGIAFEGSALPMDELRINMTAVNKMAAFLPEDQLYGFSGSSSSQAMMVSSPSSMKGAWPPPPKLVMLLARGRSWEGLVARGSTTVVCGFSWKEEEEEEEEEEIDWSWSPMGMVVVGSRSVLWSGKLVRGAVFVRLVSRRGVGGYGRMEKDRHENSPLPLPLPRIDRGDKDSSGMWNSPK